MNSQATPSLGIGQLQCFHFFPMDVKQPPPHSQVDTKMQIRCLSMPCHYPVWAITHSELAKLWTQLRELPELADVGNHLHSPLLLLSLPFQQTDDEFTATE